MNFDRLYINGAWVPSTGTDLIQVENPFTMKTFAAVPSGTPEDADNAIAAANNAFPAWSNTTLDERIQLMTRFLEIFKNKAQDIIDLEVLELGSPVTFTKSAHCDYQFTRIQSYIDLAPTVPMVEKMPYSTTYRAPIGVITCITPWNYPLGQIVQKVIPALLMGNTVVLKPSQQTPLTAYVMAQSFHEAQFPAGVFNMVTGRSGQVGDVLTSHKDVHMISFTGSTSAGIRVSQQALNTVKHISLELGGKSPSIILPSTDASYYESAIRACFNTIFLNSGQTCTALSRLLLPKKDLSTFESIMNKVIQEYPVGDPNLESTKVGPVASMAQFNTIKSYIEKGIAEGATLFAGTVPTDPQNGYFINPTIFTNVTNDMVIAREEIFGPVLCVLTYDTVEEAIAIANDTTFGLSGAVWGPKEEAIAVAQHMETGNIYINDSIRDTAAPFGGWKESGIGREGGVYGMIEFTQQRALFDSSDNWK